MPNKRRNGKMKVTFWVTGVQRQMLQALAEDAELNMTEMFREMLEAYASVRNIKIDFSEVEEAVKKTTTRKRKENTQR